MGGKNEGFYATQKNSLLHKMSVPSSSYTTTYTHFIGRGCFPTCYEGLICDKESNTCILSPNDLPKVVNLPMNYYGMPPERDQMNVGSCSSFAFASIMEYRIRHDLGLNWEVSPLYFHQMQLSIDDFGSAQNVSRLAVGGGSLEKILKVATNYGTIAEERYPYSKLIMRMNLSEPFISLPSETVIDEAKRIRLQKFEWIVRQYENVQTSNVESIKYSLASGYPVYASFNLWYITSSF